jgi:hypothetical protein
MTPHTNTVFVGVMMLSSLLSAPAAIVPRIQRADYEGDRAALARLYDELTPFTSQVDARVASRVRYWRGFALWRRAINGFNVPSPDVPDIERDLGQAVMEFDEAVRIDAAFADARVAAASCLGYLMFVHRSDAARIQEILPRYLQLMKESIAAAPDNPRVLWVYGVSQWYSPPGLSAEQIAERQKTALATYERGVPIAAEQARAARDVLEPSWGEAELLMNLAWANLNRSQPDLEAAERYARRALALVPHWHYVRDILLPQVERARARR